MPISVSQQHRIVADMAAYEAAWLKLDGAAENEILKIENQQPLLLRDYFRKRYTYWQALYSDPLYFIDE
ncbi:hypothetical protein PEC302110_13260 [Pectobacterium araliae]|uniref:Uncharacterized protein n=2 Tax=Pectobacterium araliae TaxID=3073862 RepID=A0AAN0KLK4_9GAMM|nr:hypothetical protein PEC302110_13260 [Pectobacterium sp. MAFF 302110]